MTELPSVLPSGAADPASRAVADLALAALREVGRIRHSGHDLQVPEFARAVAQAATAADQDALGRRILDLRERGIGDAAILDEIIPAAVTILGEAWEQDTATFMTVTIGSSRLQALARTVAARLEAEAPPPGSVAGLLVVPDSEDHTLGAIIAASQYQRAGCDVTLLMKAPAGTATEAARRRAWDFVVVAVSHDRNLPEIARLVAALRQALPVPAPVLIAGALVRRREDILRVTGADGGVRTVEDTLALVEAGRFRPLELAVGHV